MFTLTELPQGFQELSKTSAALLDQILSKVLLKPKELLITAGDALTVKKPAEAYYRVREGFAKFEVAGRVLFFYEEGELAGLERLHDLPEARLFGEFAVVFDVYPRDALLAEIYSSKELRAMWHEYLERQLLLHTLLLVPLTRTDLRVEPETRVFEGGTAIIIEDTEALEVYTLLTGYAEVFVGTKKVGEVLPGEIFGAMAAASNMRRSASVIAKNRCVVLALRKENFLALAQTHPETLFKLVEDMSRVIVSQNEKLSSAGLTT